MASASEASGPVANQTSSISDATGGLTSRLLSTRTLASFQRRAPPGRLGVGTQGRPDPGHLVGGDGDAGARPAAQDGGVGPAPGHQLADPAPDGGPAEVLAARRADQHDLVTPAPQVVGQGVGEGRPLVAAECDAPVGYG